MSLSNIADAINDCTACGLYRHCELAVPGVGPENAEIVIIGEGPGNEEDISGKPFVGPSGKLLTRLLGDAGIDRTQVFITNVVKCRPPDNRTPTSDEAAACRDHLRNQLNLIQPKVVIALGRSAAQFCTGHYGHLQSLQAIPGLKTGLTDVPTPVVVTYHPSYLLRLLRGGHRDKVRARQIYDDYKVRFSMALAMSQDEEVDRFFGEEELDLNALL